MFRYIFKDINEIVPFQNGRILWYTLTDSYFWMECGDTELLTYSAAFKNRHLADKPLPYTDYYLASIVQSIMELLPEIKADIPQRVFAKINTLEKFQTYIETIKTHFQYIVSQNGIQLWESASRLVNQRLDTTLLTGGPEIYFLRHGDKMYIRWFADHVDGNGTAMWKETRGEYIVEYDTFKNAVSEFLNSFLQGMEQRIRNIERIYPNDIVDIKQVLLDQKHFQRQVQLTIQMLETEEANTVYWDEIAGSMEAILE